MTRWQRVALALGLCVLIGLVWAATTRQEYVWAARNTARYHLTQWWWEQVGEPVPGSPGRLEGHIRDAEGQPIPGARLLVTRWDGTHFSTTTAEDGRYVFPSLPADRYRPVAGAPTYADHVAAPLGIEAGATTTLDLTLVPVVAPVVTPGENLAAGEPQQLTCESPFATTALRRTLSYTSGGRPNDLTLHYLPITATAESRLPLLLTVYPGPVDSWECASLPLAAAGYAVVAVGPAYSFDLEGDVDALARLLAFVRAGEIPGADGERVAVLGGSYSTLHLLRLMQRDQALQAAVLLGPPTDLFEMRRRFEEGTFAPPFGLDRALIAAGLPTEETLLYWRYSGAFHVRPDLPPILLAHSTQDEIVPFEQSQLLAAELEAAGVPHELHIFEAASHYLLSEAEDSQKMYKLVLDFLHRSFK